MIEKFRVPSYAELDQAEARGVNRNLVSNRIAYGWDTDRALETPVNNHLLPKELLDDLAKNGISKELYRKRLELGWTEEDARRKPLRHTYSDEEIARMKASGLSMATIQNRLKRGWDWERSLSEPPRNVGRVPFKRNQTINKGRD